MMTFFSEEVAMKPALKYVRLASLMVALLAMTGVARAQAAAPAGQAPANPGYTTAEYNAYNTAKNTADPTAKIKALDAFIMQYNNPTLMPFALADEYQAYYALKNYPKTVETIDKLLALGDKVNQAQRLAALVNRAQAYVAGSTDPALQTPEMLTKTRESSAQALTVVCSLTKPANLSDDQWVAVNTIIEEKTVRDLIPRLKAARAQGIVEYPLNKIVL